jgi:hypothetical protein
VVLVQTWDSRSPQAANQIYVKANVCSVKYNPTSVFEVAVGSADHNVHVFDTRHTSGPLHVLPGGYIPTLPVLHGFDLDTMCFIFVSDLVGVYQASLMKGFSSGRSVCFALLHTTVHYFRFTVLS